MKKKLLAALLCAAMTLSLAGCGEEEKTPANNNSSTAQQSSKTENSSEQQSSDKTDNSESTPEESGSSDELKFPAVEPYAIGNIAYTNWMLSGVTEDGTDYNDEKLAQAREAFSGIFFETEGRANVVMNYEPNEYSFELSSDNTKVTLKNGDTTMAGAFTMGNGMLALVLINQAKPNITYYFCLLDEK